MSHRTAQAHFDPEVLLAPAASTAKSDGPAFGGNWKLNHKTLLEKQGTPPSN